MTGGEGRLDLKSGVAATVCSRSKSGGYSSLLYTSRSSRSSRS